MVYILVDGYRCLQVCRLVNTLCYIFRYVARLVGQYIMVYIRQIDR